MAGQQSKSLAQRLRERREFWVPVGEGKRVKVLRPREAEFVEFLGADGRTMAAGLDQVRKYVVGWEGITEADLLGPQVGASDPAPFSPELWEEVVSDSLAWLQPVARSLLQSIADHRFSLAEAEKN